MRTKLMHASVYEAANVGTSHVISLPDETYIPVGTRKIIYQLYVIEEYFLILG